MTQSNDLPAIAVGQVWQCNAQDLWAYVKSIHHHGDRESYCQVVVYVAGDRTNIESGGWNVYTNVVKHGKQSRYVSCAMSFEHDRNLVQLLYDPSNG